MPFTSIRSKLTAWYVLLLGIILVLFSILLFFFLSKRLNESVDSSLTLSARIVARSTQINNSRTPFPGLDLFFDQFMGFGRDKSYKIYDGSGNIGSLSKNFDGSQFPLSDIAYSAALKGGTSYETFIISDNHPIRVITMPVIRNGKLANLVQVGTSKKVVVDTLKNLAIILWTAVPAVLLLTALIGRFIARRALKPVAKITQTAKDIGSGANLSQRIPVPEVKDEIGELALTFNSMMDRLESSFSQMRQFSSDASHELRTPLTVLKGQSELTLGKERKPKEYQEVISSNLEEIQYMSKVLEDLFMLSKSDENQIALDYESVDLKLLIEEICRHAQIIASEKNIKIITAYIEKVQVYGDPVRLRQMIWNVIVNGIKYTQPDGEVTISLQEKKDIALITIQDNGIGISNSDLPLIFNRFYRVDKARSREEGGTGLGLSICKFIVDAHKGSIDIESTLGEGTKFKIKLPKQNLSTA
jgi:two-component system OmpR family sensor kinase